MLSTWSIEEFVKRWWITAGHPWQICCCYCTVSCLTCMQKVAKLTDSASRLAWVNIGKTIPWATLDLTISWSFSLWTSYLNSRQDVSHSWMWVSNFWKATTYWIAWSCLARNVVFFFRYIIMGEPSTTRACLHMQIGFRFSPEWLILLLSFLLAKFTEFADWLLAGCSIEI